MAELQREIVIRYPRGTLTSITRMPYDSEDIEPGLIAFVISEAVKRFRRENSSDLPVEDMFITLGFTTFEVSVEVSDRLTR